MPEVRKKYEPPMAILQRENKPKARNVNSKEEKLKKLTEDFYSDTAN
jgi:hypothetical protein